MPYDGNGNFVRVHNWTADAANGLDINATEMDAEDNGIAAALSNAVTRDGQGKMSVDFLPSVDNALNLGSASRRWATINGFPVPQINAPFSGTYAITAAEITALVTPSNYSYAPGHAYRYAANTTPGTTDMTAALQATIDQAKNGGDDAIWPRATMLVGTLTLDGSNYTIRTAGGHGTVLKQKTGTSSTTGQILIVKGQNINIGDLAFTGNIATDTGEFHHCAYLFDDALASTIQNIHFGDLYGTNIRGDVLYVGGLAAHLTTGIRFGTVSGTNVYRNLLTVAGGEVSGDKVIHDGPVGYRDFDVEPNAGGIYQPSCLRIGYVRAGIIQTTSNDSALLNDTLDIGTCDLDFNRIAATTPPYISAPGVNAQAFTIQYTRYVHVGYLKCRNYNYIPIVSTTSSLKSNVMIDVADFSNCCITETTYKSLFADQGSGGIARLEIGNLIATLFSTTKMCFNGNGMIVRVRSGTISGGLLASSIPSGHYENLTIDMNSAAGNLLAGCDDTLLTNVTITNAASATGLVSCSRNTWENVRATFSALEGSGCAQNRLINSTINGITYVYDYASGRFLSKAMADSNQTLSAIESTAESIRCTGALTAQRNLVVSAVAREYFIDNSTTGGFGVQVIGPSGTGAVLTNAKKAYFEHDGTNVVQSTPDK